MTKQVKRPVVTIDKTELASWMAGWWERSEMPAATHAEHLAGLHEELRALLEIMAGNAADYLAHVVTMGTKGTIDVKILPDDAAASPDVP